MDQTFLISLAKRGIVVISPRLLQSRLHVKTDVKTAPRQARFTLVQKKTVHLPGLLRPGLDIYVKLNDPEFCNVNH